MLGRATCVQSVESSTIINMVDITAVSDSKLGPLLIQELTIPQETKKTSGEVSCFWKLNGKANDKFTMDHVSHKIVFWSICILAVLMRSSLVGKSKSQAMGMTHLCLGNLPQHLCYRVWSLPDHVHIFKWLKFSSTSILFPCTVSVDNANWQLCPSAISTSIHHTFNTDELTTDGHQQPGYIEIYHKMDVDVNR